MERLEIDTAAEYAHGRIPLTDSELAAILQVLGEQVQRIGQSVANGTDWPDMAVLRAVEPVYRLYGMLRRRTGLTLK